MISTVSSIFSPLPVIPHATLRLFPLTIIIIYLLFKA
jgi:hypothetical protein